MRLFLALSVSVAWIAATASLDFASAEERNNDHRRSMGNLRPDHRTAGPAVQGSPPPESWRRQARMHHRPAQPGHYPSYDSGYGYGHSGHYYSPGYGYDPYYVDPYRRYPYPAYPPYYWRYPPPLYIPAETLYGPEAVKRFMGADRMSPAAANPRIVVIRRDNDEDEAPAQRARNARTVELAWRFIGFGDAHFANRRYADAYQRYRRAAEAASTVATAYFRQGYALVALSNYEQAARVLKQGLELDPGWARSDFRNDELFGDNQEAKRTQLDALAQAATDNPNDADLLFLVGVFLHFDGQADRAAPFFQRAAGLGAAGSNHLRAFLDRPEPAPE
jgi:tetratricopeptide (TPR) repeat protein